jgi:hypothetical protein
MGHSRIDQKCSECMKWMGRIQADSRDTKAWEQLYKHLGKKLHPIK